MRNLCLLVLLISVSVFGQNTLTPDGATTFVHKKIENLNLEIWNAVHTGKITAYRNDSLATQIKSDEIYKQTTIETTVMVPNPANPDDPYDLIGRDVKIEFDSSRQFTGVSLHYTKVLKHKKIVFELVSIAPMWRPLTESGINLGITPLFHVKIKDVKKLQGVDYPFYEALFSLRASLGDFINPYYAPYEDAEQLGQQITHYNMWYNEHYMRFSIFQDSVVGHHLAYLPIATAVDRQQKNLSIYKNQAMSKPYKDIQSELQDSVIVMVPNPDNPEDPYDLIQVQVFEFFDFNRVKDVQVVKDEKDFIIKLSKRCLLPSGGESKLEQCRNDIYYSLKKSKKQLRSQDHVVLMELLEKLVE